jgi:hypothetical protein
MPLATRFSIAGDHSMRRLFVLALLAAAARQTSAQGISNGSFEQGTGTSWQHGIDPSQVFGLSTGYYTGSVAQDGFWFAALQGHGEIFQDVAGLTVGQQYTLSFFVAPWVRYVTANGQITTPYTWEKGSNVSVTLADATNLAVSSMQTFATPYLYSPAFVNNSSVFLDPYDTWYQQLWTFTAFASTMRVSFLDPDPVYVGSASSLGNNVAIDNVTLNVATPVTATPEPATLSLAFIGLSALGAMRKRRSAR